MCDINFNSKSRRKSGYKMLAQNIKTGKLFSSFTGEPFNTGIVPKAPTYCKRLANWNSELDEHEFNRCYFYNPSYDGHTAAFVNLIDALNLKFLLGTLHAYNGEFKLVIAKITFMNNTYEGKYNGEVIAGSNVKSIKIVKKY